MVEQDLLDASELISKDRDADLHRILSSSNILGADESIESVDVAGEGNMNCTLRVQTSERTFIAKQSRPWVEKYPAIPAPMNRALYEIQFYQTVTSLDLVPTRMPNLIGLDRTRHLLVLDDLGAGKDGSFLYNQQDKTQLAEQIPTLASWLAALHQQTKDAADLPKFANRELRQLNHAHIFEIPFQHPPAIDLDAITPGLDDAAREFSEHSELVKRATELGRLYLSDGDTLLHGDFFPGSWLFTQDGLFVIDPEFCFAGRPEFDLAVCVGHLRMMEAVEQVDLLLQTYEASAQSFDRRLLDAWAGVEIIRRLLGVAQLDLSRSLEQKQELLSWAKAAVLS